MKQLKIIMEYKIIDKEHYQGFRRVMSNNLYGIININDQLICDIIYDNISFASEASLKNDRIPVCKNGKWGCIDKSGKLVIITQFDDTFLIKERCFIESYNFSRAHYQGKVCVIDRLGNVLTDKFNPDFIDEIYGDRFIFLDKHKGQHYSGTLAFDLINNNLPEFWKQISGSHSFDYYKLFEMKYFQNATYKISTLSKDYMININGDITSIVNLSFFSGIIRRIKFFIFSNFLNG